VSKHPHQYDQMSRDETIEFLSNRKCTRHVCWGVPSTPESEGEAFLPPLRMKGEAFFLQRIEEGLVSWARVEPNLLVHRLF
jgi:hypothetical protein